MWLEKPIEKWLKYHLDQLIGLEEEYVMIRETKISVNPKYLRYIKKKEELRLSSEIFVVF